MNAIDFSPLFRSAIGFDRLARLMDNARNVSDATGYPPYNIEKTGDDSYVLTMAVAGFSEADIEITAQENTLTVAGRPQPQTEDRTRFLHRGIAGRAFERRFVLADHIVVEGADLANGLLHVQLKRVVPESLKPRRITVQAGRPAIEAQAETAQAA
ncbi:Hsp20 family protein [Roseomonas sp. HJA6]|uniref:Hsp20 family protein n=1 Tax=Roseomonas alba TaxID=2846776 RepID=A0ABS7A3T1_9PROT|nr:Hsp20 family protein [Neoroseomonas alba]MBW6396956.1 Hsp20 family protein [Neoroseomonas alba]